MCRSLRSSYIWHKAQNGMHQYTVDRYESLIAARVRFLDGDHQGLLYQLRTDGRPL